MGSILYDFLSDSRLFDERVIADDFQSVPEAELLAELEKYWEYCSLRRDDIVAEVPDAGGTSLFLARTPTVAFLKRTALYVPCHIVSDPLLALARSRASATNNAFLKTAGLGPERIDRKRLADTVRFMRATRSMIAANCLRFWPRPLFDDPRQASQIHYSESLYRNELPTAVYDLLHPKAIARTVFTTDGVSYVSPNLEPCRKLSIRFEGEETQSAYFYVLHRTEVLEVEKETGRVHVAMSVPETPPSEDEFRQWVEHSVDRSALTLLEQLVEEHRIAAACGASLGLRSPLALDVMQALSWHATGIPDATVSNLVELNLPLLDGLDLDTLVRIRTDEGEAFQAFRSALEVGARELRLETDPTKLAHRKENLVHQLTEVEVAKCASQIASLRHRGVIDASIVAISLTAAVATSGWSLLAAFAAMAQGYRSFDEYRSKVKATPGYFLWRLQKESAEA